MDFEKAYEEALGRARQGLPIDEIFPELKESEDERIRKQIEQALIEHDWSATYKVSKDDCLAYIEKQKDSKVVKFDHDKEQKPAEWSEEDEACANLVLKELEQDKKDSPDYSRHFTRLIDWFTLRFKSLRPQSRWKPSEEQISSLEYFIRAWGESGSMSPQNLVLCAAKSLLTDLQKLL